GVGRFGGSGRDALTRITGDIHVPFPLFSSRDCPVTVYREDANSLARRLASEEPLDLVYLDPPYNQHPYGSNYFMLNVIATAREPTSISPVSGIPSDWNRSDYNSRRRADAAFTDLVHSLAARYLLISFNSESFIARDRLLEILAAVGEVETLETRYNTFRGSRNLRNRPVHVREYLFLVRVRSRRGRVDSAAGDVFSLKELMQ
ncbi:MAG: DNA modification methylase, partial [Spirochaetaceae bacterium]